MGLGQEVAKESDQVGGCGSALERSPAQYERKRGKERNLREGA